MRLAIFVLFPEPSIPENEISNGCFFELAGRIGFGTTDQFAPGGLLGLALDRATTVPIATPAPASAPSRINSERERFCFAGAIAAPEGVEAAVPVDFWTSAAAAPLGCCGADCGEACSDAAGWFGEEFDCGGLAEGVWAWATTEGASGKTSTSAGGGFGTVEGFSAAIADTCRLSAQPVTIATILQNLRAQVPLP